MASGTIEGSTGNQYIDSKIVWSSVANNADNTSAVTAALYYKRNNTGFLTNGTGTFTINIGGKPTSVTKHLEISTYWVKAVEATETISHNTDGSKSITISASGSISGTSLSSTSCSGTAKFDTIPRATTIDSLSCSTKYFTGSFTYKYTPKSASYYNRCNISLNLDGTFVAVKTVNYGKKTASQKTATLTLSASELSTIYNKLPSTDKGVLRFTFRTYSDSGYSNQIADAQNSEIDLYIPEDSSTMPTATMSMSPVNSLGSPFNSMYIQGYSKVKVTSSEEGKFGATVVWKNITVEGKSYGSSANYTSDYLSGYGTVYVKLSIRDSRGFANSKTVPITVIPYSKPRVVPVDGEANVACGRCDSSGNWSDSGTYLKIKARRNYSLCMENGVQKNFCGLRFRYKNASDPDYGSWNNILNNTTATDEVITSPLLSGALSATESYYVQVDAVDSIPNHTYLTFEIPTENVYIHKAGSIGSYGIGEYVDTPNTISIAKSKAIRMKSNINGIRMYNKAVSGTKELDINTKYADFNGSGNERQTFFVFGEANGAMVYGVARVANNGTTKWAGTEGVTLTTKSGGILTIVLPAVAYDIFTILSGRDFTT